MPEDSYQATGARRPSEARDSAEEEAASQPAFAACPDVPAGLDLW